MAPQPPSNTVLPSPKTTTWPAFLAAGRKLGFAESDLAKSYANSSGKTVNTSTGPVKPSGGQSTLNSTPMSNVATLGVGQQGQVPQGSPNPMSVASSLGISTGLGSMASGSNLYGVPVDTGQIEGRPHFIPLKPSRLVAKSDPIGSAPSRDMPGEHSGSRISDRPDGSPRLGNTSTHTPHGLNGKQNDYGLSEILAQLEQGGGSSGFAYRDFSKQAADQVSGIYAPQYANLDRARTDSQTQYGKSDSTIAQLYSALTDRLNTQKQASAADYAGLGAQNQQVGQDTANTLKSAYQGTADYNAKLMKSLGIEAAAPEVLKQGASDSAWQQGQAALGTQAQGSYLTNAGTNVGNYLGDLNNASQQQGVYDRETLLNNLAKRFADIENQRGDLQSQQGQAALSLAQQLSQQDYNTQKDNYVNPVDKMMQIYQLRSGAAQTRNAAALAADDRAWSRANTTADQQLANAANDRANAELDFKMNKPDPDSYAEMVNNVANTYGDKGMKAGQVAQQVAAGWAKNSGKPGNGNNNNSAFINEVVTSVQSAFGKNADNQVMAAAIEWAKYYAKLMNFTTTGSGVNG